MDSIEEIFGATLLDAHQDKAALAEAGDDTIPSGTYRLDPTAAKPEVTGDQFPFGGAGRALVRVQADCWEVPKNGSEKRRRGKQFFDISPTIRRNDKGQLDPPSRLWAMVANVAGKDKSNREVINWLESGYPLGAFITRAYKTPDGYRTPKSEKEEQDYRDNGYVARNFIQNLRAWKD